MLSEMVVPVRTCGLYSSDQRILLVGDGNLSFALALTRAFGSGGNLTATTLDDAGFLRSNYPNVEETIDSLRACGAQVHHGVDATRLDDYEVLGMAPLPDLIVFNFPHPGWPDDWSIFHEDQAVMIERHRTLLRGFFESARRVAQRIGCPALEVHVTSKTNRNGFDRWGVAALGEECGLEHVATHLFDAQPFQKLGYRNKYGLHKEHKRHSYAWVIDDSFLIIVAVTNVFQLTC
jgi:25S rRNA (uracil2634-N3)-methyltransferase